MILRRLRIGRLSAMAFPGSRRIGLAAVSVLALALIAVATAQGGAAMAATEAARGLERFGTCAVDADFEAAAEARILWHTGAGAMSVAWPDVPVDAEAGPGPGPMCQ